jgi:hypothetical protein
MMALSIFTKMKTGTYDTDVDGKVDPGAMEFTSSTDATLSGTPKIITLVDTAGATYYVKVYPTKA